MINELTLTKDFFKLKRLRVSLTPLTDPKRKSSPEPETIRGFDYSGGLKSRLSKEPTWFQMPGTTPVSLSNSKVSGVVEVSWLKIDYLISVP